jgi:hypothetical protein
MIAQLAFPFLTDSIPVDGIAPRRRARRPRRTALPKPVQLALPLTFAPVVTRRVSQWRERMAAAWRWLVGLLALGGAVVSRRVV